MCVNSPSILLIDTLYCFGSLITEILTLQCNKLFGALKKATDVSPAIFDDLSSCIALTLCSMVICIDDFTCWSISINNFVSSESAVEIFMIGSN